MMPFHRCVKCNRLMLCKFSLLFIGRNVKLQTLKRKDDSSIVSIDKY